MLETETAGFAGIHHNEILQAQRAEGVELENLVLEVKAGGPAGTVDADVVTSRASQAHAVGQAVVAGQQADADISAVLTEQGAQRGIERFEFTGQTNRDTASATLRALAQGVDGSLYSEGLCGQ